MTLYVGANVIKAKNILTNGLLHDNTNGWYMDTSSYRVTQNDGYVSVNATITGTGTYPNYQLFNRISGSTEETKKYVYFVAKVRGYSANTSFPRVYVRYYRNGGTTGAFINLAPVDGVSGTALNDGDWHTLTYYARSYADSENYFDFDRMAFGINDTTNGDMMDIKDIMVLDLTEIFGRGNEPSKDWCDTNLAPFAFDGEKNIQIPEGLGPRATAIKRLYVGVNGIAREIKRLYVGVNGVARRIFGKSTIRHDGEATSLSKARRNIQTATVGGYALFAGGLESSDSSTVVDAYNGSLSRSNPTPMLASRYHFASVSFGDYALFGGGQPGYISTVEAYNSSLVRSNPANLGVGKYDLAGASTTFNAIFAGGYRNNTYDLTADAYDSSLTKKSANSLVATATKLAGASVGMYALFAGGSYGGNAYRISVNSYDSNLTRVMLPDGLSESRSELVGASIGDFAFFAGGYGVNSMSNVVDVYDSNLTRFIPTGLRVKKRNFAAASLDGYALFGGGELSQTAPNNQVDAYDNTLTRFLFASLSIARREPGAASVGNYVLFGGGNTSSSYATSVLTDSVEKFRLW